MGGGVDPSVSKTGTSQRVQAEQFGGARRPLRLYGRTHGATWEGHALRGKSWEPSSFFFGQSVRRADGRFGQRGLRPCARADAAQQPCPSIGVGGKAWRPSPAPWRMRVVRRPPRSAEALSSRERRRCRWRWACFVGATPSGPPRPPDSQLGDVLASGPSSRVGPASSRSGNQAANGAAVGPVADGGPTAPPPQALDALAAVSALVAAGAWVAADAACAKVVPADIAGALGKLDPV